MRLRIRRWRDEHLAPFVEAAAEGLRLLVHAGAPLLDVVLRLALAQAFFVSGVLKLGNWEGALTLARYEYPVAWMDPVTAAWLGVTIEIAGPVLLALGLATRAAAIPMLVLTLVVQFYYRALDVHLFWIALLGWYAVRGAGPFSLDHVLRRGLADSALPLAGAMRLAGWLTRRAGPVYLLAVRLWLVAGIGVAIVRPGATALQAVFPVQSFASVPGAMAAAFASLLLLGFGTRLAALAALVVLMVLTPALPVWPGLLLLWLALYGAGPLSIDALIARALGRWFPRIAGGLGFDPVHASRVVIVGAGFGGLACAVGLRRARAMVTLIDRHNYHLFQPLLYQVATTALSDGDIAMPVRGLLRDERNIRVLLGEVQDIDRQRQEVVVASQRIPYDYLVLATGATHSYFGRDEWARHAPGLKRIEDATEVRRRVLLAFERAETATDEVERAALLTFLIVGGGPTGVELAGAIAELAHYGMEREFRSFDPARSRVLLVQSGARILPTFPASLSAAATRALARLGVEVITDSRVQDIDADGVVVDGQRIAARTVLWAAGVAASKAGQWLGCAVDKAGRIRVRPDLGVAEMVNVFAIGDTAVVEAWNGRAVPGLAPAAKQAGTYVARVIRARLSGRRAPAPFRYRHLGNLATIGRRAAVADFGRVRLSGALAWWLWGAVHIAYLVGVRNRVSVVFDWVWAYLTYRSGTRLISGARADAGAAGVAVAARAPHD